MKKNYGLSLQNGMTEKIQSHGCFFSNSARGTPSGVLVGPDRSPGRGTTAPGGPRAKRRWHRRPRDLAARSRTATEHRLAREKAGFSAQTSESTNTTVDALHCPSARSLRARGWCSARRRSSRPRRRSRQCPHLHGSGIDGAAGPSRSLSRLRSALRTLCF